MDILKAQNITKDFSNTRALSNIDLTVEEGKIFGLLGPNGAGKSTLIRIINQILAPDTGTLELFGKPQKETDVYNIGYLPEERGLYKKMKIGEQSLYLAQLKGLSKSDAKQKLAYWFEKFEISDWMNKRVDELSKGMQQKVQFITTILHEPKLLIFDEPFSGFDPINANIIKQEILSLKEKGTTILLSTHNMASVEELCDKIALINKSEKILEGEVNNIKREYKSNVFEITYSGYYDKFTTTLTSNYELLTQAKDGDFTKITVRLLEDLTTNQLINQLMNSGNIVEFKEVLPSMNDIFIKVVESYKKEAYHENN